jgi:hypothetical protein
MEGTMNRSSVWIALLGLLFASPARADTAVTVANPTFTAPAPGIPVGEAANTEATCGPPEVGTSASADWTTFANSEYTSISSWLALAPDGTLANLTSVGDRENGLVQVMAGQDTRTNVNRVTASVYVLAGQVYVQIGNGGSGGGSTGPSSTTGTWEELSACGRPDMLNNEIILYGTEPAVFYVREVKAFFDPTCPSCTHAPDKVGPPLDPSCGDCEAAVCAIDDYCCTITWDDLCVAEALEEC